MIYHVYYRDRFMAELQSWDGVILNASKDEGNYQWTIRQESGNSNSVDQHPRPAVDAGATERRPFTPDRDAVMKFAEAMLARLDQAAREGRMGWQSKVALPSAELHALLGKALSRNNPNLISVANYIMMLYTRNEAFSPYTVLAEMQFQLGVTQPSQSRLDNNPPLVGVYEPQKHVPEPWRIIAAWGLDFLSGSAVEALSRDRYTPVDKLNNLKQARDFIDKAIAVEIARRDANT